MQGKEKSIHFFECFSFPLLSLMAYGLSFYAEAVKLTLGNSAYRANSCAGSAVNTCTAIDIILRVTSRNTTNRTSAFTSTTHNTSITNYMSHNKILLFIPIC